MSALSEEESLNNSKSFFKSSREMDFYKVFRVDFNALFGATFELFIISDAFRFFLINFPVRMIHLSQRNYFFWSYSKQTILHSCTDLTLNVLVILKRNSSRFLAETNQIRKTEISY